MALSDCIKCWSTPCECGYEYRSWSKARRIYLAANILGVTQDDLKKALTSIPTTPRYNVKEKKDAKT